MPPRGRTEPAARHEYGRRMHVDADPDFREFMFGWDWREPERELVVDPQQFAAEEPTLAAQSHHQSDVAPLRFGRVLSEAEADEAAKPLIIMPGPNALDPARSLPNPSRFAALSRWRRREGFNDAWGWLIPSYRSDMSGMCRCAPLRSAMRSICALTRGDMPMAGMRRP